jgi:hypothetical protein
MRAQADGPRASLEEQQSLRAFEPEGDFNFIDCCAIDPPDWRRLTVPNLGHDVGWKSPEHTQQPWIFNLITYVNLN